MSDLKETYNFEHEHLEDAELHRVREFAHVLGAITDVRRIVIGIDMSDDNPVQTAIGQFETCEPIGIPTMYVEDGFLGQSGVPQFSPVISRGGKRSAHGVFFGDLSFGDGPVIPLAVKPHKGEAALQTCFGEYVNNRAVHDMRFPNLRPMGFLIDSRERAYSFTIRDDLLTTLDSMDWGDFYPHLDKNPAMREMWLAVARQIAYLHDQGNSSHGDLAARNIAVSADGGVMIIDWEKASLRSVPPRDAEVRYTHSYADLSTLLESMCRPPQDTFKPGIGILYGKEGDWWQAFREIFFDEYKETRLLLSEQGSHHSSRAHEIREELQVLEASLKNEDIEMMRQMSESMQKAHQ